MSVPPEEPKKKYYVVWEGKKKGVMDSWHLCKSSVHGVKGARYKSFSNLAEARYAFQQGYARYLRGPSLSVKAIFTPLRKGHPEKEGLCVDASCSGNPGRLEYRGVDMSTHEEVFRKGPIERGTNNIGEFLALVRGLKLLKENQDDRPLYSDSAVAISWVKRREVRTTLDPTPNNRYLFKLIYQAIKWLEANHYDTPIIKWSTDRWGEIPADFGRK